MTSLLDIGAPAPDTVPAPLAVMRADIHPLAVIVAALHAPHAMTRDHLGPHYAPTSQYRPHGGEYECLIPTLD